MKKLLVLCIPLILMACASGTKRMDQAQNSLCAQSDSSSTSPYCLMPLAKKGDPDAQYSLGTMYYYGKGIQQDYKEAGKWWKLSAAQEGSMTQPYSQYYLALLLKDGKGMEKNLGEAARLLTMSNLKEAIQSLGEVRSVMIKDLHQRCLFKHLQTIKNDIQHRIVAEECDRKTKRMKLMEVIKAYEDD